MRKAKLYQLLAVAGGLSVAVASTPAWAKPVANVDVVTPLNWTAGTATVDGDVSDWGDLSGGNIMCTAGSLGVDGCEGNGKEQLSTVYLRYDCSTSTMYVLVLEADGKDAERSESDAWVTVGGNSNKVLENFAWVGNTDGYEASFTMTEDSDNVQVHLNVSGNTSSTGKNGDTSSITGLDSCEMPVVEDPPAEDPPAEDPPAEDPPAEDPPVEDPVSDTGNPNMACEDINGSNGVPMSLIAKYETNGSGEYVFEKGTDIINITDADLSGGTWSVEGGVVKVGAIIVKGGTTALPDEDGDDSFSNAGLTNKGGQTADISNVQFCQVPVFDASEQVCLWSANKDADGNYINIVQEGCTDAEQGKFYAIEAGGEFSSALEAE